MSKITQSAISQKLLNQKKKKKFIQVTYFYTFLPILGSKFKIQMAENLCSIFFDICKIDTYRSSKRPNGDTLKNPK